MREPTLDLVYTISDSIEHVVESFFVDYLFGSVVEQHGIRANVVVDLG